MENSVISKWGDFVLLSFEEFLDIKTKIIGNRMKCFDCWITFSPFYSPDLVCRHVNI